MTNGVLCEFFHRTITDHEKSDEENREETRLVFQKDMILLKTSYGHAIQAATVF